MPRHTSTRIFETPDGEAYVAKLFIKYSFYRGHGGTLIDPPEGDTAEIQTVEVKWDRTPPETVVRELDGFLESDGLTSELVHAFYEDRAEAAEYRAEAIREDRMLAGL